MRNITSRWCPKLGNISILLRDHDRRGLFLILDEFSVYQSVEDGNISLYLIGELCLTVPQNIFCKDAVKLHMTAHPAALICQQY